jgi:NADH dehydrogenase [ubiquinone] 1 alpha subcomplex assembly factor 7
VTPLEQLIREMIANEGPMRLDRYMGLCLGHPEHGYYMTRDPLGERGDFLTAPEVGQVFGELIGVWAITAWAAIGHPAAFNLIELGPGRGTLMSDLLRVARKSAAGFVAGASVHLVETSPVLRAKQQEILGGQASWHSDIAAIPEGPTILVANEFFDAIPIRQFERRGGTWFERVVGVRDEALAIGLGPAGLGPRGHDGDIVETAAMRTAIANEIGRRLAAHPGMALIIDYGHLATAPGDTLQAMKAHGFVPITETPGECDITSHVDFEALARAVRAGGAETPPAITQREFLLAMGIEQRTQHLMHRAEPGMRAVLERQSLRLADENQMGNLFKVLAAVSPGLAAPYPFGRQ